MDQNLAVNARSYDEIYGSQRTFLRYPADWIIRFHAIYLRQKIPTGRVLDFGCGSGNNAKLFADKGYEVHGTEITQDALPLIKENLGTTERFKILPPDAERLPYEDGYFDVIISNQVLCYLSSKDRIKAIVDEFHRCLRPGGAVFITTMGPRNYYIADGLAKPVGENLYELKIGDGHRLNGFHQVMYIVPDEAELRAIFSKFETLTVGHFDHRMFECPSDFHWIFAGLKP
jgi:SAM-dependent methyltransferase